MVGMEVDHFGIVNACLQESHRPNERALASVAILQDRLDRLKQSHAAFAGLSFSPQVQQFSEYTAASAVS
jgi:hypothetical protein